MERRQEIILNHFEQLQRLGAENTALKTELDRLTAELAGYRKAEADGRILPDCLKCSLRGFGDCILSNCIGKAKWSDTDNEFIPVTEAALTKGGE